MIWLDPERLEVRSSASGLDVTCGERAWTGLTAKRAFPWSAPDGPVAFSDASSVVAMIASLGQVSGEARALLEAAIDGMRIVPLVTAVRSVMLLGGAYSWDVETDRGPRTFRTEHGWRKPPVAALPDGGLLIRATDGLRYRLPPLHQLDPAAKKKLETLI